MAVIGVLVVAAGLAPVGLFAELANDRVQIPLNRGGLTSSRWICFCCIDLAPAGEAVLAFALAAVIGAYLRRTLVGPGQVRRGILTGEPPAVARHYRATDGRSVEIELVALDVLHHDARLVVVIGRQ